MTAYIVGQLVFLLMIAALIGGVIWAVMIMRKPRPPRDEFDDEFDDSDDDEFDDD